MSFTVISVPDSFALVYNPMIVTCISSNNTQPNYKYVFDIVIGSLTKRFKLSARPDGYGLIDIHRVLESYLSWDFSIEGQGTLFNTNTASSYTVNFYEEYGTTPVVSALRATFTKNIINAALKTSLGSGGVAVNWIDYNENDYLMLASNTKKFLTSSPRTIYIDDNEAYALYAMRNGGFTSAMNARFIFYNAAGGVINTRNIPLQNFSYIRVACGTRNINIAGNTSDLVGCVRYTMQLFNASSIVLSELFTFIIKEQCTKTIEHFRLHWLNELGGFDAFNFNYTFKRNFDIKKSTFQKMLGAVSSGVVTFEADQQGKVQFNTVGTEKIQITSDWITEDEAKWLSSLLLSPQVFWEPVQPSADKVAWIPVIVRTLTYQQKTYAVDNKLFALNIEIEIGNDIIKQRQ